MTRRIASLAAVFLLAPSGWVAPAQEAEVGGQTQPPGNALDPLGANPARAPRRQAVDSGPHRGNREFQFAMTEDVEVMRHLLHEAVGDVYRWRMHSVAVSRPGKLLGIEQSPAMLSGVVSLDVQEPLATYLENYGVVLQLKAPPLHEEPEKKEDDPTATAKPRTRWEATRLRLLGAPEKSTELEGGDAASDNSQDATLRARVALEDVVAFDVIGSDPSDSVPTKSHLTQKLLDLLVENGHNFRHLKPEERLTVAVTFAGKQASSAGPGRASGWSSGAGLETDPFAAGAAAGANMDMMMGPATMEAMPGAAPGPGYAMGMPGMMGMAGQAEAPAAGMAGAAEMMPSGMPMYSAGIRGSAGDYGAAPSALTTGDLHLRQGNYEKAVAAYERAIREAVKADPYGHQPTGYEVPMYQKLLQAQVGAGQYDKANQLLEAIQNAQAKVVSYEKPEPRFPARLVVSATKAQLDQVAAGTMSREQFGKEVTVQYFEPQPIAADSAEPE